MKRYVAHITIETTAPLRIGSSTIDFIVDMPILRDWNGLPYIPGTSIAGMLRAQFDEEEAKEIFGYIVEKEDDGSASKVVISSALLVDEQGRVNEGLLLNKSEFLRIFDDLPIREHTAINERGVAKDKSKFDEEVLYKGSRFRFAIESDAKESFFGLLDLLASSFTRLGGGNTKGFGNFRPVKIECEEMDLERYVEYSGSLNDSLAESYKPKSQSGHKRVRYRLELKPDLSFHFGSGYGDIVDGAEVDKSYVTEPVVDYEKGRLSEEKILIPATSIKGALVHRTLYHYNRRLENTSEDGNYIRQLPELFGAKKGDKEEGKGKVYMSDCYLDEREAKVFDHVKIDRFTGGAYEGALFNENCVIDGGQFVIEIEMEDIKDSEIVAAFEDSLKDIANGMLPLGGSVMKGHGIFSGRVIKDGVEI